MNLTKPLKAKACRACKTLFQPRSAWAKACSPMCGLEIARQANEKKAKAAAVADKRETRARKEAIKPIGEHRAEAKVAMQKMRRLEELAKGRGCMSCGRSQSEVVGTDGWKPGGAWDGGHYLGKGARPELALEPLNIWLQCKSCNAGSSKYARKGYTVNVSFRVNLIETIGLETVEWLEGPHASKNYTIEDLKAIKKACNARSRELLKGQE